MKNFRPLLVSLAVALFLSAPALHAADAKTTAAIAAADDERAAAMISGDRARLDAIFSDDLRYIHSNGNVDTKASFMEALTTNRSDYQAIDSEQREIRTIAPGIALVSGRSRVKVLSGGNQLDLYLGHLSVYREENGKWRFIAWQSARLPMPTPAPAK